jgi:hypothetical protein
MRQSRSVMMGALVVLLALTTGFAPGNTTAVAADMVIYDDNLGAGWQNWSWSTTVDFAATSPVYGGARSLAVTYTAGWAGLYLAAGQVVDSSPYDTLQFWIHGGSQGGQKLRVVLADGSYNLLADQAVAVPVSAGAWTQVKIPLATLGSPAQIGGIVWQDTSGGAQPKFYLDSISLINAGLVPPPPPPPVAGPDLSVDASAGRHTINDDIYGMNYADENLAAKLRLPVRRWGGNSTTRYNWQTNMHNVGSDWYFENIPDGSPVADGSASDLFVEQNRRTGTRTIMTVPLIGWTPKGTSPGGHPYDCGYKVSKYGAQQSTDPWDSDCGNGVRTNGTSITGNDPGDTSSAIGPNFVTDWVYHLTAKYGMAQNGGVAYYNLDNEPMLWNSTHRDVHPQPTSYDEMRNRTVQYAAAIKNADPSAKTLGPVLWGWCAYFYSALDGCGAGADYTSHGNTPFVPWYLQQMKAYEQANAVRILDYLDLHYYPQANGVALSPAGGASTQALRLSSTRSLWDATYIDESWISDTAPGGVAVRLIPRMKEWVTTNYPNTRLAITEYNWGALNHLNGALTQADVLGIFGREGLDLATLWGPPAATDPGAFAFLMYRNYDGGGKGFGEESIKAVSTNQSSLAVYAAQRNADKALTLVVINKTANSYTSNVSVSGFTPAATAAVYRYSGANLGAIEHAADQAVSGQSFSATFPGNSITLLVLAQGAPPPPPPVAITIAPLTATVPTGKSQQFMAKVSGTTNTGVIWQVNGVTGGTSTVGTITTSGHYTAPVEVPTPAAVAVTAIASADTSKSAKATVTVSEPVYAAVTLLAPNGGETLASGGTFTIRWGAPATATSFKLTYSLNNGANWQTITSSNVTGKSYVWKVPTVAATKTTCLVKVVGYDTKSKQMGVDQSDKPFTIKK